MVEGAREFFRTKAGQVTAIVLVAAGLAAAVYSIRANLGESPVTRSTREWVFVDAKTGKSFELEIQNGMKFPVPAPSGGDTGYPAEKCFWTRDGKIKKEPTYVLLNQYLSKRGPTFCPDCGRLVRPQTPPPLPTDRPPPLESEYKPGAENSE